MKKQDFDRYRIEDGKGFTLADIATDDTGIYRDKEDAAQHLQKNVEEMATWQDKLYADNRFALLVILQAMDSGGKDGAVKHVMSGVNPQGTQVYSFKQPSPEELDHDYLWRINKCLPERGRIGIFNRSYYEDVLVVKVHDLLPSWEKEDSKHDVWKRRYRQIRDFERYLFENRIIPVKFFLHISKEEQKKRLLARIDDPAKNWKFAAGDLEERKFWDDYQKCYEDAIRETASKEAPWHVIPADKKWFARLAISVIINRTMEKLDPRYPVVSDEQKAILADCRKKLESE